MKPLATYRLQLRPGFGFAEVAELADYLAALGISHVYLSPYLQAAPGSTHGYDVVDPSQLNRELGGNAAHAHMVERLRACGLGQLVDVVPNHMATVTPDNCYWWDLLEHGASSRYANYFDIDWRSSDAGSHHKVMMPILSDHYGRVLESGGVRVELDSERFVLRVHERHVLPLNPSAAGALLAEAAASCASDELGFIADAFGGLSQPAPTGDLAQPVELGRRDRNAAVLAGMLRRLLATDAQVAAAVDTVIERVNHDIDALDRLIERQNYRIAYWRTGRYDLDYRRFFDIDTLAALRADRADVFNDTHALVLSWVANGEVDGLRIDHPDGLRDPAAYLARLRRHAPNAWILVEKILAADETLPASWPVEGTTGYDFSALVTALFVDENAEHALSEACGNFTGVPFEAFADVARQQKRLVQDALIASELNRLTNLLTDVCEHHARFRDYSRPELRDALRELAACMPVYRTYVQPGTRADQSDAGYIDRAAAQAERHEASFDPRLLQFIARILRGDIDGPKEAALRSRFQQMCAAVTAKGVEDTAFYRYPRLLPLNDVGADPGVFGASLERFHAFCTRIQTSHPTTLLASSTHDCKRSEDVRARIALLSEIPARWSEAVQHWSELSARYRTDARPDRNIEYYLYQTLVGAWPVELERVLLHLEKAAREAKQQTSWLEPNAAYEQALANFVRGIFGDARLCAEIAGFVAMLEKPARISSLAQLALKLTAPGVPDIYQGNEVWRYDLTDPDCRRPVAFDGVCAKLERVRSASASDVLQDRDPDLLKLFVTHRLLQLRRRNPVTFGVEGAYRPLAVQGPRARHVVAFSRGEQVVTVVPRLLLALGGDWGQTEVTLPDGDFEHALSGERVHGCAQRVAGLLERFPIAVLVAR